MDRKEVAKLGPFRTSVLRRFKFGDADASADDLLIHCSQQIKGVPEFLSGTKNIVIGERGVGKSALFKLVVEGVFKVVNESGEKNRKQIVVPINEELDYTAIANAIEGRYVQKGGKGFGKYRFLWELYIISNVVECVIKEEGEDEELRQLRQDIEVFFGIQIARKFRFIDLIKNIKFTAAVKVDQQGTYTPSVAIEQGKQQEAESFDVNDKHVSSLKERVRALLKIRKIVALVLVDKIDDFVVGLDYEEQKKNIQALIECTQSMRLPELKLKIFLRADIFQRLDFEKIGYDKIVSQTVRLQWTSEDICELVARRLAYNFSEHKVPRPKWIISNEWLDVDPNLKEEVNDLFRSRDPDGLWQALKLIIKAAKIAVKMKFSGRKRESHSERKTNYNKEFFLRVITFIFPSKVPVFDKNRKKLEIAIENFFDANFKFGGDGPNPRLVLLMLNFVCEEACQYYGKNPDKGQIEINGNDEYEVILKEHVYRGYCRLQESSREMIIQMNSRWRKPLYRMFNAISVLGDESRLSLAKIRELTGWDLADEDFDVFLASYKHLGLFVVENDGARPEDRLYSLPIVVSKLRTYIG